MVHHMKPNGQTHAFREPLPVFGNEAWDMDGHEVSAPEAARRFDDLVRNDYPYYRAEDLSWTVGTKLTHDSMLRMEGLLDYGEVDSFPAEDWQEREYAS